MRENIVLVERLTNCAGLDAVLYTRIAPTIEPLTPENLADLAIKSVGKTDPGRDGISHLIAVRDSGIRAALSDECKAEILR